MPQNHRSAHLLPPSLPARTSCWRAWQLVSRAPHSSSSCRCRPTNLRCSKPRPKDPKKEIRSHHAVETDRRYCLYKYVSYYAGIQKGFYLYVFFFGGLIQITLDFWLALRLERLSLSSMVNTSGIQWQHAASKAPPFYHIFYTNIRRLRL